MLRTRLKSLGVYKPKKVVTNKDLEKYMDTSDEWIVQRSGISERRWVEPGETLLSMATSASNQALSRASLTANDIDAIIYTSLLSDYIFPGTGCLLQRELGCSDTIPALDIRNQCSGFLYALSVADAWIRAGFYKRILISAAEIHSTSLDLTTRGRDISVLFGDAAASCIVEACKESEPHIIRHHLASEGANAEKLFLAKPSPNDFPRIDPKSWDDSDIYPYMDGRFVFKNAVERMTQSLTRVLKEESLKPTDLDFVVAHQANMRINQMVLDQLGLSPTKTHHTIDRYGNTTACTIPLTLDEAIQHAKVKSGDLVGLVAFGSGFTWGSCLLRI
ncbi:MAG: 3-oxoacyl-ACP synthase [Bdellovibrionales bacterium CG10_big_fil_rev_8_21_14_0_10_45_34]|nr:MAG: 3-oxoacyl-ACP synthase [Bdellovibrionales bacterium CG10_big_fil_rev_8_21_14_0_10_45_34]